jgi:tetratricopeptide (TPR) repeat protein
MSAALPVLYEQNVRSALPQITLAPRGCFLFCVGKSEAVRARIEDALAERMGPGKAVVRGSLGGNRADLWRALTRARAGSGAAPEHTVLSFRLGVEDPADRHRLERFNMGRETRVLERLRLLLWFDGFEQLDRFRSEAPDLWVFRSDVQLYLSREDFEVPEPVVPVKGFDATIAEIDARLDRPWSASLDRISLLTQKARLMAEQGRFEQALRLVDQAEQEYRQSKSEDRRARARIRSAYWRAQQRPDHGAEVGVHAGEAMRPAVAHEDVMLAYVTSDELSHSLACAEKFGNAISVRDAQLRHGERSLADEYWAPTGATFPLVDRADVWTRIGLLGRAEADVDEAERAIDRAPRGEKDHWLGRAGVAERRAEIASCRGRVTESLTQRHLESACARKIQAWEHLDEALRDVTLAYRRLGLLGDARSIAIEVLDRLGRVGDPLHRAEWQSWLGDTASDAGDPAEAGRCYEAAAETIDALRAGARSPERAALLTLADAQVHGERWARILSPDAAVLHRARAERLLLDVLRQPVSAGRHMEAQLALGCLYRAWSRFDESTACLVAYRDRARVDQGPARAARASIELARTSLARGDAGDALGHLAAAQADLNREEPLYRSRFVQKEILVVTHEAHREAGDLAAAHASLAEARAVVRAEGLRLEELDVIQLLAELPPAPGAEDHRLAAANEAIAVAREVMGFSEEARALGTLASLQMDAGAPEAARGTLDEAAWIACAVGPEPLRLRVREIADRLARGAAAP